MNFIFIRSNIAWAYFWSLSWVNFWLIFQHYWKILLSSINRSNMKFPLVNVNIFLKKGSEFKADFTQNKQQIIKPNCTWIFTNIVCMKNIPFIKLNACETISERLDLGLWLFDNCYILFFYGIGFWTNFNSVVIWIKII